MNADENKLSPLLSARRSLFVEEEEEERSCSYRMFIRNTELLNDTEVVHTVVCFIRDSLQPYTGGWTYGTVGGKLPTLGEGFLSLGPSLGQSGLLLLSPLLPPPGEAECLFPPAYGELLTVLVGRTGIFSFNPELRNLALRGITARLRAAPL